MARCAALVRITDWRASGRTSLKRLLWLPIMTTMDWKQVIKGWQAQPPEEQARLSRQRIPLNVAESMAFAGEPVDLKMLEEEHARRELRGEPAPKSEL